MECYLILFGDTTVGADENAHNASVTVSGARVQRRIAILQSNSHHIK